MKNKGTLEKSSDKWKLDEWNCGGVEEVGESAIVNIHSLLCIYQKNKIKAKNKNKLQD